MAKAPQRPTARPLDPYQDPPPRALTRDSPADGPTALMRASWRDPDDHDPKGRAPREIRGHRSYDPLRAMLRRHGPRSAVTERHIWAADRLRQAVDLYAYGASAAPLWDALGHGFGPSLGPGEAAVARLRAESIVRRVRTLFHPGEARMLGAILLENRSITAWTLSRYGSDAPRLRRQETDLLVELLDRLEAHFAAEIDADVRAGRLLAAV